MVPVGFSGAAVPLGFSGAAVPVGFSGAEEEEEEEEMDAMALLRISRVPPTEKSPIPRNNSNSFVT